MEAGRSKRPLFHSHGGGWAQLSTAEFDDDDDDAMGWDLDVVGEGVLLIFPIIFLSLPHI